MINPYQEPAVVGPITSGIVAAGTKVIIASMKTPLDLDTYLVYYGNSISNQADANFSLFRIKLNGSPMSAPFDNLGTQFGSVATPTKLPAPKLLGRGVLVELEGEQLAGASGTNTMAATAGLVYVTPGKVPGNV